MCSSHQFGLFIGYFNICLYGILVITLLYRLGNVEKFAEEKVERNPALKLIGYNSTSITYQLLFLAVGVLMIGISALLVTGVLKRRHKYIFPWLLLSVIILICTCIYNMGEFAQAKRRGKAISGVIVIGACMQSMVLFRIYSLYRDIRQENFEMPGYY